MINCLSCVNRFESNLLMMGTSNKSLMIYDVCTQKVITTYESAHDRPIHTISLNEHATTQGDCNLVLTSATDGVIKLWDIRNSNQKCIRRFQQHKNAIHTIACQMSPCIKYLVTGSEDRNTYIYDVLSGSCIHRLQSCHSDVVSSAQFVPHRSDRMATCSFDGTVKFYKNAPN